MKRTVKNVFCLIIAVAVIMCNLITACAAAPGLEDAPGTSDVPDNLVIEDAFDQVEYQKTQAEAEARAAAEAKAAEAAEAARVKDVVDLNTDTAYELGTGAGNDETEEIVFYGDGYHGEEETVSQSSAAPATGISPQMRVFIVAVVLIVGGLVVVLLGDRKSKAANKPSKNKK